MMLSIKPRSSFDTVDTLLSPISPIGKFSQPNLRRHSSTTSLRENVNTNTPQIIHRSLSSIFKKIPKQWDEKKENDSYSFDDSASITSSDSSQISINEKDAKNSNKLFSMLNNFGGAFNNNKSNNNDKRRRFNFNEIIVSNEIIITTDLLDECDDNFTNALYTTYETHLQTPTHNYSYYYPTRQPIGSNVLPNLNEEPLSRASSVRLSIPKIELSTSHLNVPNEKGIKETQTSPQNEGSEATLNPPNVISNEALHVISATTSPIISPNSLNKDDSSLSIPPLNISPRLIHDTTTEAWPFARFPQRSSFHSLSDLPPSIPSSPSLSRSTSMRSIRSIQTSFSTPPPSESPSPIDTKSTANLNNYNYGLCEKCKRPRTGILWCQPCYSLIFQKNFCNWTSGHDNIDEFIRKAQLNSNNINELLEWIPFNRFNDLQFIGEGGYSIVFSAKWIDGRILDLNEDGKWDRTGENEVILKVLNDSTSIPQEYLNELEGYYKYNPKLNNVLRCYGISTDPFTKKTIMVMEYAKDGNLKEYLKNHFMEFTWTRRISILNDVTQSLKSIHATELVHKNLHSGNVLIHDNCAFIGDLGLCSPKIQDDGSTSSYGVMPYVAPEILKGNQFTTVSDIYSFGMIMYELATSLPPYHDYSSDDRLLHDICDGKRPKVPEGIPNSYVELMTQCWSQNPNDRPNMDFIAQTIEDWKNNISNVEEFNIAEQLRLSAIIEMGGAINTQEKLLSDYKSKALPKF